MWLNIIICLLFLRKNNYTNKTILNKITKIHSKTIKLRSNSTTQFFIYPTSKTFTKCANHCRENYVFLCCSLYAESIIVWHISVYLCLYLRYSVQSLLYLQLKFLTNRYLALEFLLHCAEPPPHLLALSRVPLLHRFYLRAHLRNPREHIFIFHYPTIPLFDMFTSL